MRLVEDDEVEMKWIFNANYSPSFWGFSRYHVVYVSAIQPLLALSLTFYFNFRSDWFTSLSFVQQKAENRIKRSDTTAPWRRSWRFQFQSQFAEWIPSTIDSEFLQRRLWIQFKTRIFDVGIQSKEKKEQDWRRNETRKLKIWMKIKICRRFSISRSMSSTSLDFVRFLRKLTRRWGGEAVCRTFLLLHLSLFIMSLWHLISSIGARMERRERREKVRSVTSTAADSEGGCYSYNVRWPEILKKSDELVVVENKILHLESSLIKNVPECSLTVESQSSWLESYKL